MRRIVLASCVVLAALAVTAIAGASSKDGSLSVVAYSTPKTVFGKIIQAWQQTADGKGVSFTQSYGASTDQAKAVAAGLNADLVFLSTGRRREHPRRRGPRRQELGQAGLQGDRGRHGGRIRRPQRQPQAHQELVDLVKPGVQVVTPNPFSSGSAKWNILAAYGAQRRLGKTDAQAQAFVKKLFQHVVSQDTSGRNATNTFLSGKGDVLLTYESEALTSRAAGTDIQYVIPRQTMLIELPIAVLEVELEQGPREQVHPLHQGRGRPGSVRPVRLASGQPDGREEVRVEVPGRGPASSGSTTRSSAAGGRSTRSGSARAGSWPGSSAVSGGQPLASAAPTAAAAPRGSSWARERAETALSLGFVTAYLTLIVVLPLAAVVAASGEDGWSGFWSAVSNPEAVAALKLSVVVAVLAALVNAVFGTITAWVLVRDHFRGRSIVNSVIDLPFALPTIVAGLVLLALYGPQLADRRPPRVHAVGDLHGAAVRHPAVRRPDGAAGAARARHRHGGGGALARRRRSSPSSGGSSCRTSCPGSSRAIALAFARAVGEIGSIVLISGNHPFHTEVASVYVLNQVQIGPTGGAPRRSRSSCS